MHGKLFLLDTGYAGIDDQHLYCRLDFLGKAGEWTAAGTQLVMTVESLTPASGKGRSHRLEADVSGGKIQRWTFSEENHANDVQSDGSIHVCLESIFECQIPLALLGVSMGSTLLIRFSLWRDRLPLDALPQEGAIQIHVVAEDSLGDLAYDRP